MRKSRRRRGGASRIWNSITSIFGSKTAVAPAGPSNGNRTTVIEQNVQPVAGQTVQPVAGQTVQSVAKNGNGSAGGTRRRRRKSIRRKKRFV